MWGHRENPPERTVPQTTPSALLTKTQEGRFQKPLGTRQTLAQRPPRQTDRKHVPEHLSRWRLKCEQTRSSGDVVTETAGQTGEAFTFWAGPAHSLPLAAPAAVQLRPFEPDPEAANT